MFHTQEMRKSMIEKFEYQQIDEWLIAANFLLNKIESQPATFTSIAEYLGTLLREHIGYANTVKGAIIDYNQLVTSSRLPSSPIDKEQLARDGEALKEWIVSLGNVLDHISKSIYTHIEFDNIVSKI